MDKRVVLVTGASSGIGKAAAKLFADGGCTVYGTSRKASGEKTYESQSGGSITMISLDVNDDLSVKKCVDAVLGCEKRIDVLVNNAGFGIAGAIEDTAVDEMQKQLDTNLFGLHRVTKVVLPSMRENGGGKIINISSVAGFLSIPYQAFYSVSKYGVEAYSRALRCEVAQFGIDVAMVQPGDTKTGFTKERVTVKNVGDAYKDKLNISIKRMANDEQNGVSPEKVAKAVVKMSKKRHMPVSVTVGIQYKAIKFAVRFIPERIVSFAIRKLYA